MWITLHAGLATGVAVANSGHSQGLAAGRNVFFLFRFVAWIIVTAVRLVLFVVNAFLMLSDFVMTAAGRRQEFAADRYAAHMGFGISLEKALTRFLDEGEPDEAGIRARLTATHPPLAERIRRLESLNAA